MIGNVHGGMVFEIPTTQSFIVSDNFGVSCTADIGMGGQASQ
jgi:hypothetical protein